MSFFDPHHRRTSPSARVSMALFRLSQAIKKMTQLESTPHGLSPVQVQTMLFIRHTRWDMSTVGNLAAALGTTHATAVGIVNGLLSKKYVNKKQKPDDRRVTLLQLTPEGAEVMETIGEWGDSLESALTDIPEERLSSFEIVLGSILHTLEKRGHLAIAEPCLGCLHFRPEAGDDPERPHFCNAIQRYLSEAESQKESPEHTPAPYNG